MQTEDHCHIEKRLLGRTGLEVSILGYGTAELRGPNWRWSGRPVAPERAGQVLNAVLDAGINLIDTAIDYGASEELIGRYLSGRRSEYFLASKCGCLIDPAEFTPANRNRHVFTRHNITAGVEQSLRRMKTDYLDIVQFHGSPSRRVVEEEHAIDTLLALQREGKVRWIGTSSILPDVLDLIDMGVFDVFQLPYSALERKHENVISLAARSGAGIIIRGGLAQGMADRHAAIGMRPTREGTMSPCEIWARARLDELLDGMRPMEFLARFVLTHQDVHTMIAGTLDPGHLAENLDAVRKGPLALPLYAEAKRRLQAAGQAAFEAGGG